MKYITIDGDTFDKIAQTYYDDSTLSSTIIEANQSLARTVVFSPGIELEIPEVETIEEQNIPPWRR